MRLFTLPGTRATVQCPAQPRPAPSALVGALTLLLTLTASLAWAQPTWSVAPPASICDNDNGSTTGTVAVTINPVVGANNYLWRFQKRVGGVDRGEIVGGTDSIVDANTTWSILRVAAPGGVTVTLNITNGSTGGSARNLEVRSEPAVGVPTTFLSASITLFETPVAPGAIDNAAFTQCSGATNVNYNTSDGADDFWTITGVTGSFSVAPTVNSGNGQTDVGTTSAGGSFTLNAFQIANGCTSVATSQVITVVGSVAPAAITGTTTHCAGTTGVAFSSTGANFWSITGGSGASITGGQGTASVTVNVGTANFTLQAFTVTGSCTSAASSQPITVTALPAQPGGITGTTTQTCGATGVAYGSTLANFWAIVGGTGASIAGGQGTASVTVDVGTANFTLEAYTITGGCTSVVRSASITVNPPAQPGVITGTTTQTCGATGVAFGSTGATFWAIVGGTGASIAGGQGTASVTVDVGTANFTLEAYTIAGGCTSAVRSTNITVNPPAQPGAITGTTTQTCGATGVAFGSTLANFWAIVGGTGASIAGGQGTASVTVDVGTANFTLEAYTITGGCTSVVRSANITVNPPAQPGAITGTTTQTCGATGVAFGSTLANFWTITGGTGASITAGGTTASVTVDVGTANFTLNAFTIAAGCTSAVQSQAITVNPPAQPGSITGTTTQSCGATGVAFGSTGANFWAIVGGTGASIASGQGTASITVDVGTANFTLQAYAVAAGCTSTVRTVNVTVNPPAQPPAITGTASQPCGTTGVAFSSTGANFWVIVGGTGASITGGQGTDNVTVSVGTANFTLEAYTIAGGCTSTSRTQAITVTPPAQPGVIGGAAFTQCASTTGLIYTATNANFWTITGGTGAAITAGGTTASVTVDVGTANFTLNAFQISGGCTSTVRSQAITVNAIPAQSAAITAGAGGFIKCTGQTGLTFTSTNADFWQLTANTSGATITAGGATATVTVSAGATAGAFTLNAFNIVAGCTSAVRTQVVTVEATPAAPAAIGGAAFTQCSGSGTYVYTSTGANFWSITGPTGFSVAPSISAGQGTASLTVNVGATTYPTNGSFTLNAFVTTANCTSLASSQTITVNATPTAPAGFTGPNVCVDGTASATYSVTAATGDIFNWSIPPGTGTIVASGTDTYSALNANSIQVIWNALPAGTNQTTRTITISRTRAGCTGPSITPTATIRRTPIGTITGSSTASALTFEQYSVAAQTGVTYAWSLPTPGTNVAFASPTNTDIVQLSFGAGAAGPVVLRAVLTNSGTPNCPTTVDFPITVTSCPNFTSPVTVLDNTLCDGDQAVYTLSPASFQGTLTWEVSTTGAAGPYSAAPGSINNSPVYLSPVLTVGTYHVRTRATQAACPDQVSTPVQVDVSNAPTVGTLTALSQDVCRIFSNRLELPPGSTGGNPVVWELNASPNPLALSPIWNSAPGTETTLQQEFRVSPFNTIPLAIYVNRFATFRARVGLACGEAISNQVGVRIQNSPSGSITNFPAGFDTVCVGDLIQLSARLGDNGRMEGQWFANTSNGVFSTGDTSFIANPSADSLARFTPNPAAAGQNINFRWNVRAGNCPTVDYFTTNLFVVAQPQGTFSYPSGSPDPNPCVFTVSQPVTASASSGLGYFELVSIPATPLDPSTTIYNSQQFGFGGAYFPVSFYTPTPSIGATVQYQIGPGDAGKVMQLRWVVDNAYCAPTSVVTASFTVNPASVQGDFPDPPFNACPGEATPGLGASLAGGAAGTWLAFRASDFSTTSGFSSISNPNATFTPSLGDTAGGGVYIYWQVTNAACPGRLAYYGGWLLDVTPVPQGNLADTAVSAIRICIDDSTNNQDARTLKGVGLWTITGPGTGTFRNPVTGAIDPANPRAYYRPGPGDGNQTFGLTWRITNGACVTPDLNSRLIRVDALSAGAFPDTTTLRICAGDLTPPLGATVANGSIGFWDIIPVPGYSAGAGGFSGGLSNPNARYFSLVSDTGKFVRARWTATNGVCNPVIVTRDVFVRELSQGGLEAASLIEVCEGDTTPRLGAFVVHGVGRWEAPNPPVNGLNGTFFSPDSADPLTDPRALYIPGVGDVTGATGQAVKTLRWTVTNSTCTPVSYTRNITVFQTPSGGISGALTRSTCFGDPPVAFTATNGPGTTVQWFSSGSGTFSAPTSASTSYTPAQADTNTTVTIRFRVTSAGGCATVEDTVFLNVFRVFADARRSISQICLPSASAVVDSARLTVVGNFSPTSSYVWSVPPGINPSDLSSQIVRSPLFKSRAGMALGTYVFTVTVTDPTRGNCAGTDTISVRVTDGGSVVIADPYNPMDPPGDFNRVCLGVPFTMRASPGPVTSISAYNWNLVTGSANLVGPTNLDSLVAEVTGGGATFRVSAVTLPSLCVVSDEISITSYAVIQPNLQAASTCPEEPVKVIVAAGLSSATEQCQFLRWFRGDIGAQGGNFTATNPNFLKETPNAQFQAGPGGVLQDTLSYERGGRDPMTGDLTVGNYEFCVFCIYPAGCESQAQAEYAVVPQPQAAFVGAPSVDTTTQSSSEVRVSFFNSSVYFRASRATPGTLPPVTSRTLDVFLWNFGDTASGDLNRAVTDTATHVYTRDGEFTVTLFVADNLGCSSVLPRPSFVKVDRPDFFFPQAFTPDQKLIASPPPGVTADINETFRPLPASIDSNKYEITRFEVFNSKGVLVYDTRSPLGWDGRLSNGDMAETGVYTYVVEVQFFGSAAAAVRRRYTGQVRLLR